MRLVVAFLLALCLSSSASAELIKYVAKANGFGRGSIPFASIGGVPFNGAFTITATADTDNITRVSQYEVELVTDHAEITIEQLATTYQFTTPIKARALATIALLGPFSIAAGETLDWELATPVATSPAASQVSNLGRDGWATSGGLLLFQNGIINQGSLTATIIPEPSSLILVGCLLPLAFRRLR